jgi:glycosyltransferase involved in cell wall biosynthesis
VLFVETHAHDQSASRFQLREAEKASGVTVLQIFIPRARWEDSAYVDRERRAVLQRVMQNELGGAFSRPLLWFYDPMVVRSYAGHLNERLIVYDCMDELSQFKGAPPELIAKERELLTRADVVFCGGRKMRAKRLPLNPNCHFYGTGVDIVHFGQTRSADLVVAPEIASLPKPVLGYFGVVDERLDYELLAKLADANPDWSVVMVGPWIKVDPKDFPRRPNLHWLGGKPYTELPAITKGFDVCLMPFALNAATEYINPTKALEYMAAGRPVVSTALDEVKTNFADVARVAASHEEFIKWCKRETSGPSVRRIERGVKLAAENTWEAICAKMQGHIEAALLARQSSRAARGEPGTIAIETTLAYV